MTRDSQVLIRRLKRRAAQAIIAVCALAFVGVFVYAAVIVPAILYFYGLITLSFGLAWAVMVLAKDDDA